MKKNIDNILDKISNKGYDSLSPIEKEILYKIGEKGFDSLSENEKEFLSKTGKRRMKERRKYGHTDRGFWGWFFSISYTIFLILFTDFMSELSGWKIFLQGLVISVIFIFSYKKIFNKSWFDMTGVHPLFYPLVTGIPVLLFIYLFNNYFNLGLSNYVLLFFWNLTFSLEILFNKISDRKTDKMEKIEDSRFQTKKDLWKSNINDRL